METHLCFQALTCYVSANTYKTITHNFNSAVSCFDNTEEISVSVLAENKKYVLLLVKIGIVLSFIYQ